MTVPRDDDPANDGARAADANDARGRIEPRLGWLDGIRFQEPSRSSATSSSASAGWRRALVWAAGMFIALAAIVFFFRQPLADRLWPETRAQVLRERAAQALSQGRLTAPDGTGARELYAAALALDPDRNEARDGLMSVAAEALRQARAAVAQNRYADAHKALQLARDMSAPRAQTDAVATLLRRQEADHAGIDGLLARAAAARGAGRLDDGPMTALPLYQRVLALQPERTEALEGREDALADLLQQSRQLLAGAKPVEAARIIGRVRSYDPGHVGLPEAEAQLARAIEQERRGADRDLRDGRLASALAGYRTLLQIDSNDADARSGVENSGIGYARRAEKRASDFRFTEAEQDLRVAREISPDSGVVRDATRHIERARLAQSRIAPPLSAGARKGRLRDLLAESDQAASRGDWLTPPGDSAYDKLRAAQALAPTDAAVKRAAARILPAVRRCYEDDLRGNRLRSAQNCLEAWQQIDAGDRGLTAARQRLAQRWLAVGNERLGAGEIAFATQALAEARALDPGAPGLDEFATRVRTASPADRR